MVVTQLWATQQKRLQSQPGGRIWFGPKSKFWLRQFREKPIKSFCKPLIFLKIHTMKFGLFGLGPSWSNAKISLLSLIISVTSVPEYICMSLKRMKWHVVCVASARPALHGQSIIRKTYVNSYILSQKSLWRKCRHIFWVIWKSFNSLKEAIPLKIQWVSCLR